MTTITREQAQKIIDAADKVITALAGTNEDVHPDNSQEMIRLYDDLNDHYAPPVVVRELARIALASLEAEPVAYIFKHPAGELFWSLTDESNKGQNDVMPVYAAQPAPERERIRREYAEWSDMQFLLWDAQRRAGNTPVQSPIDHGYRPECECSGCKATARICAELNNEEAGIFADGYNVGLLPCPFCGSPAEHYPDGDMEGYIIMCGNKNGDCNLQTFGFTTPEEAEKAWNTRAAIPQTGNFRENPISSTNNFRKIADTSTNSPVIPDGYALVPVEPTDEMIAAAMNCEDVLFNSDESFCVQFGNIYEAMLAAAPQH